MARLRLLKEHGGNEAGAVITVPASEASELLRLKVAALDTEALAAEPKASKPKAKKTK